jgi:predicted DNA-binding antitoxin AbrB/MazE fold protein
MIRTVRARYCDGKLEPLEKLDLDEGEEVVLSIGERPLDPSTLEDDAAWEELSERIRISREDSRPPSDELLAADKAWRETHDHEAFKRMIYLARKEGSRERPNP